MTSPGAGAPRQADVRRAISAAYYGVFHLILKALADEFVGSAGRKSKRYALVYRSVDHKSFKDLCLETQKATMPAKFRAYLPTGGFGPDIKAFAAAAVDLQEQRHIADYDPLPRFTVREAELAIELAETAAKRFRDATAEDCKIFLTFLMCPPRPGS